MLVSNDLIQKSVDRQPDLDTLIPAVSGKNPAQLETPDLMAMRKKMLLTQTAEQPDFAMERLIGNSDLMPFNYFQKGEKVGKSVGRVLVKDAASTLVGYGTGFMISPVLMMTNKHVLPTDGDVHTSQLEFGFELDLNGNISNAVTFDLAPGKFFYADADLDFSIVAVSPTDVSTQHQLSDYGYLILNPDKGKVALGEYLSIIQHPDGREKQIAIRENQVVDHEGSDDFIWYKTDTAPGSSGSPVFNDQWQLVALHHMGVPETDANGDYKSVTGEVVPKDSPEIDSDKLVWKANEGIRVSRIVAVLQQNKGNDAFVQQVITAGVQVTDASAPPVAPVQNIADEEKPVINAPTVVNQPVIIPPVVNQPVQNSVDTSNNITFTVPLNITVSLGNVQQQAAPAVNPVVIAAPQAPEFDEAKLIIDTDYSNRKGFDENFLGQHVGLPTVADDLKSDITPVTNTADNILRYNHFSIVMNKPRKMAWFTAVNIDSVSWAKLKDQIPSRKDIGADTWITDSRVDTADQVGKGFYAGNDFDIGHQVRREDPVWGPTVEFAIKCNNDTFHLTNACPQHKEFNQGTGPADPGDTTKGKTLWQGLENYILDNAHQNGLNVNVYTGPVFGANDKPFQNTGILIPEAFWKVVVLQKSSGGLSATAYLVSQASLIENMLEEFVFGKYRTYQVAVKHIEELTKLSFGLSQFDPLNNLPLNAQESLELQKPQKIKLLNSVHDIVF